MRAGVRSGAIPKGSATLDAFARLSTRPPSLDTDESREEWWEWWREEKERRCQQERLQNFILEVTGIGFVVWALLMMIWRLVY